MSFFRTLANRDAVAPLSDSILPGREAGGLFSEIHSFHRASHPVTSALQASSNKTTATPSAALTSGAVLSAAESQPSASFLRTDRVDNTNPSDFYRFNVGQSGVFTASLTELNGDADVRLIQDGNNNGTIETSEVLAWQWERGPTNESIRRFLNPGTYYVQVLSYNNQTTNYSLTTNLTPAERDDQQFSLQVSFAQGLEGLGQAARDAVVQAAKFWETVIPSRSAVTASNSLTIEISGESFVLQDGSANVGTLALSGPTVGLDASYTNSVITRGSSTLNSRRFTDFNNNPGYFRDVMIHEFAHVLGFGTLWEPLQFSFSDGTTRTIGQNFIDRNTSTYRANTYAGAAYGELMGTFNQTAVPLEARAFSHWDENRFGVELMTPYAESPGTPTPASMLTLAALRDLGWNVNFGAAQAFALASVPAQMAASTTAGGVSPQRAGYAAYQCGCGICLSASEVKKLGPTRLADAILA